MSAKGRFDPEQLLDARGGQSPGSLELNRTNLALWARAQIGLRLQGASMPPISFSRSPRWPAAWAGLPGSAHSLRCRPGRSAPPAAASGGLSMTAPVGRVGAGVRAAA